MKFGPGTPISFVQSVVQHNLSHAVTTIILAAIAILTAFVLGAAIDGCAGFSAPPPTSTSEIAASPSSVSFGNAAIGGSFRQTIRITNNKSTALQLSKLSLSGYGFTLTSVPSSLKISAYGSISFNVGFAPHSATKYSATLRVFSGSTIIHTVPVSGTGVWTTALTATPSQAVFGSVPVGVSNSQTIRLENDLSVPVSLGPMTVSGSGFAVTDVPSDRTIASHGYLTFDVVFTPQAATSYVASLPLISDNVRVNSIRLSGTGIGAKTSLSLSTSRLNFGSHGVGTKTTLPVVLTSDGNSSVTISGISVSGSGFSASGIANGTILKAGQFATLEVGFDPAVAGSSTGKITVVSEGASVPGVSLSGTGVSATSSSVSLHWDVTSGASGYYVYRGSKSGGPYVRVNSTIVAAADYVDSTVDLGQTYYYVVTSVNPEHVESSYSNQAQVTVPANP